MIYMDNAASSWPKPEGVWLAMEKIVRNVGANPSRGAHRLALEAGRALYQAREKVAEFFGAPDPTGVVFTHNATAALNQAIKGYLHPGDHVVTTSMEHNSVIRPLRSMARSGVEVTVVQCNGEGFLRPEDLKKAVRPNTRMIALTHASNVTGTLMPVGEVVEIARQGEAILLLDVAQTAGLLPFSLHELQADMIAFPGHKGLLGPQGTGGLYIRPGLVLEPLLEGGTGSHSELEYQPDVLPDRYESGTPNTVGLAGLAAGIDFIRQVGVDEIRRHEADLIAHFLEELKNIPEVKVYGPRDPARRVGVVSLNLGDIGSSEVGFMLDRVYDIAVRTGLHCSPLAHQTLGTVRQGTVRFSFSFFNTHEEVSEAVKALRAIAREFSE